MECTIQSHFRTQLPYLLLVFAVSSVAYIVCGFSGNNLIWSWAVGVVCLVITAVVWTLVYPHLKSSEKDMYFDNEDDMTKGLCHQKEEDEEFIKSFMYNDSLICTVFSKRQRTRRIFSSFFPH